MTQPPPERFSTPEELVEQIDRITDAESRQAIRNVWQTLAGYANHNAERLDTANQVIRRFSFTAIGALLIILAIMVATGIATVKLTINQGDDSQHARAGARQAVQISRYDNSYFSCLAADQGNLLGRRDILKVIRDPTRSNIYQLIDDIRPLRSTTAPPPPPLPHHLPTAWVDACRSYAGRQVSLNAPADAPTPPGNVTAPKH